MRKLTTIIAVLALLGLVAGAALAATTDSAVVTVTVEEVESLIVPDATFALSLTQAANHAGIAAYDTTTTTLGGFQYSHNYVELRAIEVKAVHRGANLANDITLALALPSAYNGGQIHNTLVSAGVDSTDGAVWRIVRGAYATEFIWTVNGTLANTPRGAYIYDVTATCVADPGAP